ncbi:MAG: hypothetical protein V2A54_16900 [Bacteroidota bacterium]
MKAAENNSLSSGEISAPKDTVKKILTRSEIIKKLKVLASSPVPKDLETRGAMCYEMAAPPTTADYICPVCGNKTTYPKEMVEFIEEIPACRSHVKSLKELNAMLEEKAYCKKCSPQITDPTLCLIISYADDPEPYKVCDVHTSDFILINEFLSGTLKHHNFYDGESPLVDYIARLEVLLGNKKIKKQKP